MSRDDSTIKAKLENVPAEIRFFRLEIHLSSQAQRLHFLGPETVFEIGTESGESWTASWNPPNTFVFRTERGESKETILGSFFVLGSIRARVIDIRTVQPYALLMHENGQSARRWEFSEGIYYIGRPGKRQNQVRFEDASISRQHACLKISDQEALIQAESATALTAVNSRQLSTGQSKALCNGDQIQLGRHKLVWVKESSAGTVNPLAFRLQLLGGFRLFRRRESELFETRLSMEKSRMLLAWLVLNHKIGPPLERTLEFFWPQKTLLRQRKNLSHLINSLQSELKLSDDLFRLFLHRTSDSLRVNTHCFESVDVWELSQSRKAVTETQSLAQLHPAPLLPEFNEAWLRGPRCQFFLDWLNSIRSRPNTLQQRALLLEKITELLRGAEWEEFHYEVCFQIALEWDGQDLAKLWFWEYQKKLEADTGDKPSSELNSLYRDVIGKVSE